MADRDGRVDDPVVGLGDPDGDLAGFGGHPGGEVSRDPGAVVAQHRGQEAGDAAQILGGTDLRLR
ncbi:hypothetical protein [Actinoplanes sp. NPDC051494]|uniref:hypothetical protein n=1 Tax=Actinoplanes sp. NPDC051494 TaxID=3363907 RepID=UPI0037B5FC94